MRFWHWRPSADLVADIKGDGRPVVLLHGQPGSASDWDAVAEDLARDHRVIVPDRLGYGRTGGRAGGFAANANAVAKLLHRLGESEALVVGHSWAGGVALELALDFPASVAALALISSVAPSEPPARMDRVLALPVIGNVLAAVALGTAGRLLLSGPGRARRRGQSLAKMASSWPRAATWRSFTIEQRALVHELPLLGPRLGALDVPTAVVVGSADRVVGQAASRQLATAIPMATLEVVQGGGHLLPLRQPDRVAAVARRLTSYQPR